MPAAFYIKMVWWRFHFGKGEKEKGTGTITAEKGTHTSVLSDLISKRISGIVPP